MGDRLLHDIGIYTDSVVSAAQKTAKDIQREMLPMVERSSPVRKYSTHTQTVQRIVVNRSPPAVIKAIKEIKEEKFQPGAFRYGWTKGNIRLKGGGMLYGVRNAALPTITHLLNFDHELVSHGIRRGTVRGTGFVSDVQEWSERELDRRLSEFLQKG